MISSSKERNLSIDVVKIIAMLGVIMLHTTHDLMSKNGLDVASFMYKTAVISIPLFFMVSGYLLLGRDNLTYEYVFTKIVKILRYVLFFCVCGWLIRGVVKEGGLALPQLFDLVCGAAIGQGSFYVFWYFAAIILIYLLLPILNYVFKRRYNIFIGLMALCLVVQNIIFTNLIVFGGYEVVSPLRQYNWLSYFMLGGYLMRGSITIEMYGLY